MNATRIMLSGGLNKTFRLCGMSKKAWYYTPQPRNVSPDPEVQDMVQDMVQKIGLKRPTYGTRRMSTQVSKELSRPVNHKAIRRIFKRLGWSKPSRTKHKIIRSNK